MVKDILSVGLKNLVGVPLLQAQSQLIGSANLPASSRSLLNTGVAAQSVGLLGENLKYTKKSFKGL